MQKILWSVFYGKLNPLTALSKCVSWSIILISTLFYVPPLESHSKTALRSPVIKEMFNCVEHSGSHGFWSIFAKQMWWQHSQLFSHSNNIFKELIRCKILHLDVNSNALAGHTRPGPSFPVQSKFPALLIYKTAFPPSQYRWSDFLWASAQETQCPYITCKYCFL